ncbi:MAG: hypothetical protein ACREJN_14430, partial [Nitrospiraceae bacterium]
SGHITIPQFGFMPRLRERGYVMFQTVGVKDCAPASQCAVYRTVEIAAGSVVFMLCLMLEDKSTTIAADDAYIAGYAAAVLHNEFKAAKAIGAGTKWSRDG